MFENYVVISHHLKQYINTRYLCPPEAMHRLLEYVLHETSHTIPVENINSDFHVDNPR